jgi:HPt (histidine-containing phosphotransfer) domain-containing protein
MAQMETRSSPDTPVVLDPATLNVLADQLEEGFDQLVVRFRRRLQETPATIRAAWGAGERSEVGREAHSLKSVAATFGAPAVSATSTELEERAPTGSREELDDLVARLDRDCSAAGEAIAAWSEGSAAAGDVPS